jgi:hypothetical protein
LVIFQKAGFITGERCAIFLSKRIVPCLSG